MAAVMVRGASTGTTTRERNVLFVGLGGVLWVEAEGQPRRLIISSRFVCEAGEGRVQMFRLSALGQAPLVVRTRRRRVTAH